MKRQGNGYLTSSLTHLIKSKLVCLPSIVPKTQGQVRRHLPRRMLMMIPKTRRFSKQMPLLRQCLCNRAGPLVNHYSKTTPWTPISRHLPRAWKRAVLTQTAVHLMWLPLSLTDRFITVSTMTGILSEVSTFTTLIPCKNADANLFPKTIWRSRLLRSDLTHIWTNWKSRRKIGVQILLKKCHQPLERSWKVSWTRWECSATLN